MRLRDPLRAQALYYICGGLWPIVHLRSFMALTGRKSDTWLVKCFGAFLAATGLALLPDSRPAAREAQERLAVGSAVSLAAGDAWYVVRGRISPIYLADAVVELFLAAWTRRSSRSAAPR